jgi:glycine/serine hydroxymethyltransferase
MKILAKYISQIVDNPDNKVLYKKIKSEIIDLLKKFPINKI